MHKKDVGCHVECFHFLVFHFRLSFLVFFVPRRCVQRTRILKILNVRFFSPATVPSLVLLKKTEGSVCEIYPDKIVGTNKISPSSRGSEIRSIFNFTGIFRLIFFPRFVLMQMIDANGNGNSATSCTCNVQLVKSARVDTEISLNKKRNCALAVDNIEESILSLRLRRRYCG